MSSAVQGYAQNTADDAHLVWSEFDGQDDEIFYSGYNGSTWSPRVQISLFGGKDVTPAIASADDGTLWVVWASHNGATSRLYYTVRKNGSWSPASQIPSSASSNTGPSIAVDGKGIAWVAWAAFDGKDDEIMATRFLGGHWETARQVSKNDTAPDILPALGVDAGGFPMINWLGYENGNYRTFFSRWSGGAWQGEQMVDGESDYHSKVLSAAASIPHLPGFVPDLTRASIHVPDSGATPSIPLRSIKSLFPGNQADSQEAVQATRSLAASGSSAGEGSRTLGAVTEYFLGFGDSITYGKGNGGYEEYLENIMQRNGRQAVVINRGVQGESTQEGVSRIDRELQNYFLHYLLLMEGTNDIIYGVSYQTTMANLGVMIDKTRAADVVPIMANLPPNTSSGNGSWVQNTWNPNIKVLADKKGVALCDQYGALVGGWVNYSDDGIHPNNAGYSVMGDAWYRTIQTVPATEPTAPTVTTMSATDIGTTTAQVHGSINPNGGKTTYYFEYGLDTLYGNQTPEKNAGQGQSLIKVSGALGGLEKTTTYHYRLVAKNQTGTTMGKDVSFTTGKTSSSSGTDPETPATGGGGGGGGGCFISAAGGNLF